MSSRISRHVLQRFCTARVVFPSRQAPPANFLRTFSSVTSAGGSKKVRVDHQEPPESRVPEQNEETAKKSRPISKPHQKSGDDESSKLKPQRPSFTPREDVKPGETHASDASPKAKRNPDPSEFDARVTKALEEEAVRPPPERPFGYVVSDPPVDRPANWGKKNRTSVPFFVFVLGSLAALYGMFRGMHFLASWIHRTPESYKTTDEKTEGRQVLVPKQPRQPKDPKEEATKGLPKDPRQPGQPKDPKDPVAVKDPSHPRDTTVAKGSNAARPHQKDNVLVGTHPGHLGAMRPADSVSSPNKPSEADVLEKSADPSHAQDFKDSHDPEKYGTKVVAEHPLHARRDGRDFENPAARDK